MNLEATIANALQLTDELHTRIAAGELSDCLQLLTARGQAVAAIAGTVAVASADEKAACSNLLAKLKQADGQLQASGEQALRQASADWNRTLGSCPAPRHEYDKAPDLACLDRKA